MWNSIRTQFAIFSIVLGLLGPSIAQQLPAGYIGTVTNNAPNTWERFEFQFTAQQTGANFIGFAFRQDPAYWTFDQVELKAQGSNTNLLQNGLFDTGGAIDITTNNGPSQIQAPTYWGVWYQAGQYPAAAGTWYDIGGTHGGVWFDGAVGTFDGIYQGIQLTQGVQYTLTFWVSGNHTSNGGSVQLGVYAGQCEQVQIAANQCTVPIAMGFQTLSTPLQGALAGNPEPQIVSQQPGAPIIVRTVIRGQTVQTQTVTRGATQSQTELRYWTDRETGRLVVSRQTTVQEQTPVQTVTTQETPVQETVDETPTEIVLWTTNEETVVLGETTTTVTVENEVVQTVENTVDVNITQWINQFYTRIDQYEKLLNIQKVNQDTILMDPLQRHRVENNTIVGFNTVPIYATPYGVRSKQYDGYKYGINGLLIGIEKRINDQSLWGLQLNFSTVTLEGQQEGGGADNTGIDFVWMKVVNDWIWRQNVGIQHTKYTNYHDIEELNLHNYGQGRGTNIWVSERLYTPQWAGFRVFGGFNLEKYQIQQITEQGDQLTAVDYNSVIDTTQNAFWGVRYSKHFGPWEGYGELQQNTSDNKKVITGIQLNQGQNRSVQLQYGIQSKNEIKQQLAKLQLKQLF